jgi:putative transposase
VKHLFVKALARVNNRAENSHQPTREREHRMRGFRDPKHLLRASLYRKQLAARFVAWCEFAEACLNPSFFF